MADLPPPPLPHRPPPPEPDDGHQRRAWTALVGLILVLALVNVAYRLVYGTGMQRSALLFIGVPALLAIGLALLPRSRSATGMVVKGCLIALCLAGVVLPEGVICLAMAAPLVLIIAVLVGGAVDLTRRQQRRQGPTMMAVVIPLLLLSLEGIGGASPIDAHDRAAATITVAAPADAVARALAAPPRFDRPLPPFLTWGFNRPVGGRGAGIEVGDRRTIEFTGGSHDDHPLRLFGGTGERSVDHHSSMDVTVVESRPGRVVFAVDRDGTMLGRWVDLDRIAVTWAPADAGTTTVTWAMEYERLVFPSFYFAPIQRYGMDEAARYLVGAVVEDQVR